MSLSPSKDYKFIKFIRSSNNQKKYDAILENKSTGRRKKISFGQRGASQYRDSTGLKLYSNFDNNDIDRKKAYRARHEGEGEPNRKYSAGWFSWNYLW
jgi:hypothetical protein